MKIVQRAGGRFEVEATCTQMVGGRPCMGAVRGATLYGGERPKRVLVTAVCIKCGATYAVEYGDDGTPPRRFEPRRELK